ncbi:MAG TPA: NFACT family protein [Terriglobia bacterium]|nr:NFACT family protein [Terriglobia bacterium]
MENFALIALAESLRPALDGCIIRRVIQHQPNGFILQTRSAKLPALKLICDARSPAFYPSEAKPPMDSPNSDFLMVLRKHFTSAELIDFKKSLSERVIELVFHTAVPSKELETMSLLLELIPNAPNIVLLDAERRVLSSFLSITPQHGISDYETYSFPRSGNKIALERVIAEEVPELQDPGITREWLVTHVAGLGPAFADEILFRHRRSGHPLTEEIRNMVLQVQMPSHTARIYTEKPLGHILEQNDLRALGKAIISPFELLSLERSHSSREFGKVTDAIRFYFDEIESRTLLEHAKLPLLRELRVASKRLTERDKRLNREQTQAEEAERLGKVAQLLTSSGKKLDQRYDTVTVTDYFADPPQEVPIELDPAITLRENIERMFKRQQKAGRGKQIVAKQLAEVHSREAAIAERIRRLQAIKDWDTWLAISDRVASERGQAPASAERPEQGGGRFKALTVDGFEILIGRNSRENDVLTFQVAGPDDFWMHVADYSGSHVVVRNPGKVKTLPDNVLLKAAQLAAYFSQARNSPKAEVHYTRRKFVSKPRRARPGLVKLSDFGSIRVEPKDWFKE